MDFGVKPPVMIIPQGWTTTKPTEPERTVVTSIRVGKDDWNWFVSKCRSQGTSTCREIRSHLHLLREEAEYPVSLRRKPLMGGIV